MNPTKKISVVLCTYNGALYIREQLDSICQQTYLNIEVIVVDDGSTDTTVQILKEYQAKDSRIVIHQNRQNLGFVQNFAKGMSLAQGELIALADQDDIWKLYKLEKLANEIGEHTMIYSDALLIDECAHITNQELIRPKYNLVSGKCNKAFVFENCASGNTIMFKRALLEYILPIPDVSFHDIWIALIASTIGTIAYVDEALIYYRRHDLQVTKTKKRQRGIRHFITKPYRKLEQIKAHKERIERSHRDVLAYLQFAQCARDAGLIELLQKLVAHFENYYRVYKNKELLAYMYLHLDELFAIYPVHRRKRIAKKYSEGYLRFMSFFWFK